MNELHLTPKNNLVWRETARWLKFVEVVEGNGIYLNVICYFQISSVVTLLHAKNKRDEIIKIFENAIDFFSKNKPNSKELEICIRENSNFQLQSNNFKSACDLLEKWRIMNPKDFRILSKLISIYSKFDNKKAKW